MQKKIIKKTILMVLLSIIYFLGCLVVKEYNEGLTEWQFDHQTYVKRNTRPISIPGTMVYLNYRSDSGLNLDENYNWLYECKLYKDFGSYPDAYLVVTSSEDIKSMREENTEAYYRFPRKNTDRYIFVSNLFSESIIHELAHFSDDVCGALSRKREWISIYGKEWEDSQWLSGYYNEDLPDEDQQALYYMESFAEGFKYWYMNMYGEIEMNNLTESEYGISIHLPHVPDEFKEFEEKFPLTCDYMEKFYENYEIIGQRL